MTTTSTIATITTDLADWLATNPLHELPPVCAIRINCRGAALQLASLDGKALTALAGWAEHLGATVALIPSLDDSYLHAVIRGPLGCGSRVDLWTRLDGHVRDAVDRLLMGRDRADIQDYSLDLTAEVLREAAEERSA